MPRRLRASRRFNGFLRLTFGTWLIRRYRLRAENLELVKTTRPPYVVLPNHVCFWDPFFVGFFIRDPIFFVTSDRQFRNRILRFLLSLVGAIPKSKAIADFETVRSIFEVKKRGGIVGIFAEGRRNWDGHSLPPLYATAKLIKALGLPVVVPILKGAFLALPRWSRKRRKGPVTVEFTQAFTEEELGALSVEKIYERMSEALRYDEWEYQRDRMARYRSRNRADGLDLALFVCQSCHEVGTLETRRHDLYCTSCGHSVTYTEYGFFGDESRFATVRDWNLWQLDYLSTYFDQKKRTAPEQAIFADGPGWMLIGHKRNAMKRHCRGTLWIYPQKLEFACETGERSEFPMSRIAGANVQTEERMEFYYENRLYSFAFDGNVSGYKWMVSISLLKGADVFTVDPTAV